MNAFRRILLVFTLLIASSQSAFAMGYGAYFEYVNVFDGELETDFGDIDYDEDHFGVGFSFDTNVAADRLFNYRLDAGYQHVEADYGNTDFDADGLVVDNAFGFGVIRNDRIRLWVGPAVRLSMDFFEDDSYDFAIGVGPEVGLNVHTGENVSIGITAGYQIFYSLTVYDDDDDYFDDYDDDDDDGYEQAALLKLHVLFRTADDTF